MVHGHQFTGRWNSEMRHGGMRKQGIKRLLEFLVLELWPIYAAVLPIRVGFWLEKWVNWLFFQAWGFWSSLAGTLAILAFPLPFTYTPESYVRYAGGVFQA